MPNRSPVQRLAILLLLLFMAWLTTSERPPVSPLQLIWQDEFNYTGLPDSNKWTYDTGGHGWGNNELQFYGDARYSNARVEKGHLIIEAHKEQYKNSQYTSARLRSAEDWKYGRVEVRAKIPKGIGTWPAIWMLGANKPLKWPDDGEIDIMEHVGYDQGVVHGTVHTKKYNHVAGTQKSATIKVPDCSDAFHVYSVEWNASTLKIAVDSSTYFTFNNEHSGYAAWPFDNPMYLILNIAVGGNWGGKQGIDSTIYPVKMEIDYVRVYQ